VQVRRPGETGRGWVGAGGRRTTWARKMQDTIFQVRMVLYPAIIRKYDRDMKLRYNYRLYPRRGQSSARARAFGCARVVFNDALRIRAEAYEAGQQQQGQGAGRAGPRARQGG